MKEPKRVLITGGAGFLGSHLCERFVGEGFRVVCLDNFITGNPDNIVHLLGNPLFSVLEVDATQFIYVEGPLHYILHFASPASPMDYLKFPIQTLKVGGLGTHKVLGLAKNKNARMLLASTSEVYGDPEVHPQPESYWGHVNPTGPRGVYDEAKRYAEAMTMAYRRYHGVNTCIVRIFNTYGPRMRTNDGRVVPAFLTQAIRGEPLTVFGSGEQSRSFCYVDDLVEGIFRLVLSDHEGPINLGNPEEFTVLQFARAVQKLFAPELQIDFRPLPTDDPRTRQPDIALARTLLGWEPQTHLEVGLQKTHEYFLRLLQPARV
ncbi:MAG: SDR family oxidoreductase [Myxococcales bacterium]|nr:SDR family oxidoreductase [Myxococcales bacterium]